MSGWLDTLFGNLPPPQPTHPASRGALLGADYAGMPTSPNVEDRRQPGANVFPSRPHDQLNRNRISPFGQTYNEDQWNWLNSHLPGGQPPTTHLQDPNFSLDPSIIAQSTAAQDRAIEAWNKAHPQENPNLPTPMPYPPDAQRGPQFSSYTPGMTLNSYPGGWQGWQ